MTFLCRTPNTSTLSLSTSQCFWTPEMSFRQNFLRQNQGLTPPHPSMTEKRLGQEKIVLKMIPLVIWKWKIDRYRGANVMRTGSWSYHKCIKGTVHYVYSIIHTDQIILVLSFWPKILLSKTLWIKDGKEREIDTEKPHYFMKSLLLFSDRTCDVHRELDWVQESCRERLLEGPRQGSMLVEIRSQSKLDHSQGHRQRPRSSGMLHITVYRSIFQVISDWRAVI